MKVSPEGLAKTLIVAVPGLALFVNWTVHAPETRVERSIALLLVAFVVSATMFLLRERIRAWRSGTVAGTMVAATVVALASVGAYAAAARLTLGIHQYFENADGSVRTTTFLVPLRPHAGAWVYGYFDCPPDRDVCANELTYVPDIQAVGNQITRLGPDGIRIPMDRWYIAWSFLLMGGYAAVVASLVLVYGIARARGLDIEIIQRFMTSE